MRDPYTAGGTESERLAHRYASRRRGRRVSGPVGSSPARAAPRRTAASWLRRCAHGSGEPGSDAEESLPGIAVREERSRDCRELARPLFREKGGTLRIRHYRPLLGELEWKRRREWWRVGGSHVPARSWASGTRRSSPQPDHRDAENSGRVASRPIPARRSLEGSRRSGAGSVRPNRTTSPESRRRSTREAPSASCQASAPLRAARIRLGRTTRRRRQQAASVPVQNAPTGRASRPERGTVLRAERDPPPHAIPRTTGPATCRFSSTPSGVLDGVDRVQHPATLGDRACRRTARQLRTPAHPRSQNRNHLASS